jgi:dienelactone hydrolase
MATEYRSWRKLGIPFLQGGEDVKGFSQGGNAVLELVDERFVSERRQMPYLKAAVAYYPYCRRPVDLTTNVYVFIGEKDDWTPAHMCDRYIPGFEKNGHALHYTKYPHAFHSFDAKRDRAIQYLGYRLAYDREAASDSFFKVRAFLARHVRE